MKKNQISKMHQHIIKRLKENNPKEDIDEIYKNYIKNKEAADSVELYFADYFNKCDIGEIKNFCKDIEMASFNYFLLKIKNIIKKEENNSLDHKDNIIFLYKLFIEIKDTEKFLEDAKIFFEFNTDKLGYYFKRSFIKIYNNEKNIDNIKSNNLINFKIEDLKSKIKEHNEISNDSIELEDLGNNIYIVRTHKNCRDLIRNITPINYCINYGIDHYYREMCSEAIFIIYDFNKKNQDGRFLYFVQADNELQDIKLTISDRYNYNVKNDSPDYIKIYNILFEKRENIYKYLYKCPAFSKSFSTPILSDETIIEENFDSNKYNNSIINLSYIYLDGDKETYEYYSNKIPKTNYNIKKENDLICDVIKLYIKVHINNYNSLQIKLFAEKIIDKNFERKYKIEIIKEIIREIYNKNSKFLVPLLTFLLVDKDFYDIIKFLIINSDDEIIIYTPIKFLKSIDYFVDLSEEKKNKLISLYKDILIYKYYPINENISEIKEIINVLIDNDIKESDLQEIYLYFYENFFNQSKLYFYEKLNEKNKLNIMNLMNLNDLIDDIELDRIIENNLTYNKYFKVNL